MGTQSPHAKLEATRPYNFLVGPLNVIVLLLVKLMRVPPKNYEADWPLILYVGFEYPYVVPTTEAFRIFQLKVQILRKTHFCPYFTTIAIE